MSGGRRVLLRPKRGRGPWWLTSITLILLAMGAALLYHMAYTPGGRGVDGLGEPQGAEGSEAVVAIYYPMLQGRIEARRMMVLAPEGDQAGVAQAAMERFLEAGRDGVESYVPPRASLLGLYMGADGVAYVNLSDEFRGNFEGSALGELLLLRAVYLTLTGNDFGIRGVTILIEGEAVRSVGGHYLLEGPITADSYILWNEPAAGPGGGVMNGAS